MPVWYPSRNRTSKLPQSATTSCLVIRMRSVILKFCGGVQIVFEAVLKPIWVAKAENRLTGARAD